MKDKDVVTIREFSSEALDGLTPEDIAYLQKDCFGYRTRSPYRITRRLHDDKIDIENTSYSGIIQLEDARIHFSTKVQANLFYMLSFLRDEKSFLYDPEVVIDIKEGNFFFDILGRLFLNELEAIFRKGFYKKYVRIEDDAKFLKGKLLVRQQMLNDIVRYPDFYCSYQDLTFNNLENQIILKATTLLIPLIRFNKRIKRDLITYSHLLREEVDLVGVVPADCDRVHYSRLNEHYEPIIKFSKVVLQNYFIRSTLRGASKGFNFIVNMNKVYEDFVSSVIEDVVNNSPEFRDFVVERQERFDSIFREKRLGNRPDVVLRRKETSEYPLIIDAKYKRQEAAADFNQVGMYALAIPTSKSCCLVYPQDEGGVTEGVCSIDRNLLDPNRPEIKVYTAKISLFFEEENLEFDEYIEKIRQEVKKKLLKCL